METEEVIKLVDNIYKNILEKFNPGARQLISAGKAYLKALHGAAAASRIFNEALAKIAVNAQQGGTTDIGSALMNIVGVYKDIQDQHMNILKAFYVDLLVPLETNLEKDTKVVQFEQKKFLQQHKIRADSYSKAAATMKKQRKKKNNPQNADKEIKTIQALDEEKNKMDAFCEQSLKNALTQERRRYGFVLERQCSLSRHWMAYHISGRNVIANQLETWEEVSSSREFLPPNVENMFAKKMKEEMILDDDDSDHESVVSAIRKTKSIDASLLDMRSLGDVINNTSNHTVNGNGMKHNTLNMPRAKSEFNLNTAVVELPPKWDQRPIVKGLYAYLSSGENQLSFLEGDRIALVGERAKGWQFGENLRTQTFGWFPVAYTEIESMENNNNWASMTPMASASSNTQTMTNTITSGSNTIPATQSSSMVGQHGNGQTMANASGVITSSTTMQTSTNPRNANGHHYYSQNNNNNSNMSNGNNMNQSNHYQQQQQFYDVTPDSSVDNSTLVDETMPSKLINSYHEDIHQSPTRMFGDTMMMRQSKQFRRVSNGVPKPGPPPTLPAPVPTPVVPSYNNNNNNNNSNLNDNHNLMHNGGNNKNNHNGGITQSHSFSSGVGGGGGGGGVNGGGIGGNNHGNSGGGVGGVGGASMIIDKRKSSPATVNLSKQQQQSSMNGNNKPKPRTNGITNASLHSSNDSGFANDPPPQPEIDYSDEDLATRVPIRRFQNNNNNNNNEQINNNKSATRMSRRRSNDFDSTTMQSLTQRQSMKNQQKSLNGKNSRHNSIRQSSSFGNLTMNTSTIDTDLSNNINNNNNNINSSSSSNNFEFLYQTNDTNNQITTNGKNGKVSVKRTKSFWKFGKSDDDILEGMALWKHRDLVQIENDQLLPQTDANGNTQIRESATINKYHPKMVIKRRKSLENNTTISTNSSETLKNSQNGNNIEDIMIIIDTKRDNQSTIIDDKTKYHITKSDIDQRISMQQQQQQQHQQPQTQDHHIYGNYGNNGVQRSKSSQKIGNNNNDEISNRIDIDNDIDDDDNVNDHHEDDMEADDDDDDMNSERYHPPRHHHHQNNNGKISRSKYLMDIQNMENDSPQYRYNNGKQQNNTNKYNTNRSDSKIPYRNVTTPNIDYYNQQDQQSLHDMVSKIDFEDDSSYLVENEANLGGGTTIMDGNNEQYPRHYNNRKHNQNTNTNNRYSNHQQQNQQHNQQHNHHQQHLIENDQRSSYDNNGQFYDDEESVNEVFLKMKTVKRKEILKQYYSSGTDTERHSSSSDPYDCIVVDDHLVRRKQHAGNGQNAINNTEHHHHNHGNHGNDGSKNAKMDFKTFRSANGQITSNNGGGGGGVGASHLDDNKDMRIIDSTTTTTRSTTLLPRTKLSKALSNGVNNNTKSSSVTAVQSNGHLTNGKKIDKQQSMNNKQQRHSNYENVSTANINAATTTTTATNNNNKRISSSSSSAIHHQQNNMENPSKSYGPWYDLWGKDATVKK